MLEDIMVYIINESGILFHFSGDKRTDTDHDLISPFLSGLDSFIKESFKLELQGLILKDLNSNKIVVHFRSFNIHDKVIKVVVIAKKDSKKNELFDIKIDGKIISLFLLIKQHFNAFIEKSMIPSSVHDDLEFKIQNIFK